MDMDVRRGLPRVIREMMITPLLAASFAVALPCADAFAWSTTTSPLGDHASESAVGPHRAAPGSAGAPAAGAPGSGSAPAGNANDGSATAGDPGDPATTSPQASATVEQRPFAGQAPGPVAPITVFGAAGSFGRAATTPLTPTGQRFAAEAVANWRFLPGQAAYFPTVADDGTVFIANEPQTDNQLLPTARQLVVSSFSPESRLFRNVVVPTSTGRTAIGGPWPHASSVVGGADVSDIAAVQVDGKQRIAFTSAMPYWGWDTATGGTFPTLGFLSRSSTGAWKPDASRHVHALDVAGSTASENAATRAAAARAATDARTASQATATRAATAKNATAARAAAPGVCTSRPNAAGQPVGDCQMPAEFAQLPSSSHLAVTQYATGDASRPSGRISVLDPSGQPLATYAYPRITRADGTTLAVHPREIDVDPLGRTGDERFVVIFDAVAGKGTPAQSLAPFAIQEFRYDARRSTIVPTSLPVLSGDAAGDGTPLGYETASYDEHGNLWVAQSQVGTLQAGPLALYLRQAGATSVLTRRAGCAASEAWSGRGWGTVCQPDERIAEAAPLGIGRSLLEDRGTGAMVLATMSGYLLPIAPVDATAADSAHVALAPIDLGLDRLADRAVRAIGPRKGVIDDRSRKLWLPIQQLATPATCAAWPCEPAALDQWLYSVDLAAVIGPVTPARAAAARRAKKAERLAAKRAERLAAKKAERLAAKRAERLAKRAQRR